MSDRVVTIDGPGGSGKSSVSTAVATILGWDHLDTGAYYRAGTLIVQRASADPNDERQVLSAVRPHRIDQRDGVTWLDGEDVSIEIRSEAVTAGVSAVSAHPELRRWFVRLQRMWVATKTAGVVAEGRDTGSVVFPTAFVKVFLTASPEERAKRRAAETGDKSDTIGAALIDRDRTDSTRSVSPLARAETAVEIDTTDIDFDTVVAIVKGLIDKAGLV